MYVYIYVYIFYIYIYIYIEYTHTHTHTHRVIHNDCRYFNNLSYTIHLRQEYIVAPMDQEILSFLL